MFGGETFSALDRCNNLVFRGPTLLQSIPGMGMQSDFHGSSLVMVRRGGVVGGPPPGRSVVAIAIIVGAGAPLLQNQCPTKPIPHKTATGLLEARPRADQC